MTIGSHNTMSYQPTKQWWAKILRFTARCQGVNLYEQYHKYGCRFFDFRVKFDKNGDPTFAHGPIQFHGHVKTYIKELNSYAERENTKVYARILLESNSRMKNQEEQEEYFKKFCENIVKECPNLIFLGGERKYDWTKVYDFNTEWPTVEDKYSSTTGTKLDDLWPWLYARLHNKKNKEIGTKCDFLLIDFVNI